MGVNGRPAVYNRELAVEILVRLADGESLRSICRSPGMPSRPTVYVWVLDNIEGFSAQYTRAREIQAHSLADDQVDIADNGSNDWMERNDPDNPGWVANGEHLLRSRLRFDARKWAASKILPKVYGDRTTIAGDADNPLITVEVQQVRAALIDRLQALARPEPLTIELDDDKSK